jgi:hypothetical protein
MVLRQGWKALLLAALAVFLPVPGAWTAEAEKPRPGEVTLPLSEYLALVERVEAVEKARQQQTARREPPVAEVVSQKTSLVVGEDESRVTSEFEVLVQGYPGKPVLLPLTGLAEKVEVTPTIASATAAPNGLLLMAPAPGRYAVRVEGRLPLDHGGGISRLVLAPVVAPVAEVQADLPADLGWSSPGSVVVEEREQGARRAVRLALSRGDSRVLELRRRVDGGEAEKLLARAVVLTILQVRPEGTRRHDVVLYEVSRGGLASFAVDLPPGLDVEQVGTDEGTVVAVPEARRLTVQRQRQLQGTTGYLVMTSTPPAAGAGTGTATLPLDFVRPGVEVRARYLAVASSVAADIRPLPDAGWARVDLDDLPDLLREALGALDLSAAWRLVAAEAQGLTLAVAELPKAPELDAVVRRRETTTLLTVDGTVVHRDRFTLEGRQQALDMVLPAGATLWSAQVGEQPVRPVERDGRLSVPLGFEGGTSVVEVVSVQERAIPGGRSRLALDLPQVGVPVLDHRWRLLLPEGARYRFRGGDLRPAREVEVAYGVEGGVEGGVPGGVVGGVVGGVEGGAVAIPEEVPAPAPPPPATEMEAARLRDGDDSRQEGQRRDRESAQFSKEIDELKQGLVGGVKPLPVSIPESGKLLLLSGVLPPEHIAVDLEVKAKR